MNTVVQLTPKQERRAFIKKVKVEHKKFVAKQPIIHESIRVDNVMELTKHCQLIQQNNKGQYVFQLSPKPLAPEVVLMLNFRMVPGRDFVHPGSRKN